MGYAIINKQNYNVSIYAWKIRRCEPIGYIDSFEGFDTEHVYIDPIDFDQDGYGAYDDPSSGYYQLNTGEKNIFYQNEPAGKEGYNFSIYEKFGRFSLPGLKLGVSVHIKPSFQYPIYADPEIILSNNQNLYPNEYSIIKINGIEYECEYLGKQNLI